MLLLTLEKEELSQNIILNSKRIELLPLLENQDLAKQRL